MCLSWLTPICCWTRSLLGGSVQKAMQRFLLGGFGKHSVTYMKHPFTTLFYRSYQWSKLQCLWGSSGLSMLQGSTPSTIEWLSHRSNIYVRQKRIAISWLEDSDRLDLHTINLNHPNTHHLLRCVTSATVADNQFSGRLTKHRSISSLSNGSLQT